MWNVGAGELYGRFVLMNMRMFVIIAHIPRVIVLMMRVLMGMRCFSSALQTERLSTKSCLKKN